MTPKIILLDGSAFLFRSYFSSQTQGLTNHEGFPTGAIFGVINSIKMLQNRYKDAEIVAIFDHKGKNFRHEIYTDYKANRKPAEEELVKQIQPLYDIIQAMGLPFLCVPGVEADDVIASLCVQAKAQQMPTMVASGDKDLFQLIDDDCICQLDMKGKLMDSQAVLDKVGILPHQILDFLSLTGDSSDNIPGIPSVGPKTAVKWLNDYGDIAGVRQNADKIKGKVGEKFRDNLDLLDLSYRLVSLKTDLDVGLDFEQCQPKPDRDKLKSLYQQYGFSQWLKQLDGQASTKPAATSESKSTPKSEEMTKDKDLCLGYIEQTLFDWSDFMDLVAKIKQHKLFVFDTETTGLNYMKDQVVGLVFLVVDKTICVDKTVYYLPLSHQYMGAPNQLDGVEVFKVLAPLLADKTIGKIGQNLKYDAHILANHDILLDGIVADTMLASYCLNSTATAHNMDDLAAFYLQHDTISFSDIAGKGKQQMCFDQVDIKTASHYACEDGIVTYELYKVLMDKLIKSPTTYKLYQKVEMPLIQVLKTIERNGVLLDIAALSSQQNTTLIVLESLKKQAYEIAKSEFNLDSPKQVRTVLFEQEYLNLEPKKTTPNGVASTNEEALKMLDHPLAKLLLEYRGLSKLNSTYLEALPKQVNPNTGRVHTSYHQSGTSTGRLSSSNPNLQNIPIRSVEGAKIRGAFIAKPGYKILAADYSQVELRIMAHLAQDYGLIKAFKQGLDVHSSTASQMFNKSLEAVSDEDRRDAKAINFGLMYGMGAHSLAKQLKCTRTKAKDYISRYFSQYPQVEGYVNTVQQQAKNQGFVETTMGRRLYLPDANSNNKMRQQHALRLAINAPMQGSSADIIKKSMLDIQNWINQSQSPIKLLMQVHDELVFEVSEDFVPEASVKINELMTQVVELSVPLIVDIGIGDNWQQAH